MRWLRLWLLPGVAVASPINYDALSNEELRSAVVMAAVFVAVMMCLGGVAFFRYRRQYQLTRKGPKPMHLLVLVACIAVAITLLFIWGAKSV